MKTRFWPSLLIAVAGFLAACGGNSNGTPSPISSTSPFPQAVDVSLSTDVSVTFNQAMDAATVNFQSFKLTATSVGAVSGQIVYSGLKATLTPSDNLALSVFYTATITGMKDVGGVPLADYSWSFTTRDGTWATPVSIDAYSVNGAHSPQIAMDAYGNGMAVWEQSNGMIPFIWARTHNRGSGWGTPAMIQDANSGQGQQPQIAMSETGSAAVVWVETDPIGKRHLNSKWFVPSQGWGASALVETNATDNVSDPYTAINAQGTAIVVWHQSNGTSNEIWANKGTPNGWGTPVRLDNAQSNALWPRVAMDGNGDAIAIWEQRDDMLSATTAVWASIFSPATGWSTSLSLPDSGLGFQEPRIAIDATGNALIVGVDWGSTPARVKAVQYLSGQGFGTPLFITNVSQQTAFADVAMNDRGDAMVVWLQSDGSINRVWAKRYSAQNGWQAAFIVDGSVGTSVRPQAAIDASGNAFVLWERDEGSLYSLMGNRCLMTTGCGTPTSINAGNDLSMYANIAVDRKGRALAVWATGPAWGNIPWHISGSVFE
jgi:hypothetical protein